MNSQFLNYRINNINKIMLQKGINHKELALKLGWEKEKLSKFMNNKMAFKIEYIEEIAKALEVDEVEINTQEPTSQTNNFKHGGNAVLYMYEPFNLINNLVDKLEKQSEIIGSQKVIIDLYKKKFGELI
jgi:transcriptional regulator with XRE-family HTH domain